MKSLKLTKDNYLDSTNIVDGHVTLDEKLNGTILYNNSSGSNETITLNDSASNYEYIEIYYRTNDNIYYTSKFYEPNDKQISLFGVNANSSYNTYYKQTIYKISEATITPTYSSQSVIYATGTCKSENYYYIYITKVIGYK